MKWQPINATLQITTDLISCAIGWIYIAPDVGPDAPPIEPDFCTEKWAHRPVAPTLED